MEAAILKSTRRFTERRWPSGEVSPARDVLHLTLIDSGADLVVSAGSEVYELASDLPAMTPVGFNVAIDGTRTHGAVARLRAISLEAVIDGERQEVSDPDWDRGTKAVRKQLTAYGKRISH